MAKEGNMNKAAQNHMKSTNTSQQYRHSTPHFSESSFNIFEQTIQGTRKHFVHCYKEETQQGFECVNV